MIARSLRPQTARCLRQLVPLARIAVMLAALASPLAAQTRAYVEQSEKAEVLLKLARKYVQESRSALAVPLLVDALDVSPDAILPETRQGAYLVLRQAIFALSAADRQAFEAAVAEPANLALRVAETAADPAAAWSKLILRYPGSEASRQAARRLAALRFEQGNFRQTIETVDLLLADPLVTDENRRTAICLQALAAAELGEAGRARRAADQVKATPQGDRFVLAGREFAVGDEVERLLALPSRSTTLWSTVLGRADRTGLASSPLHFDARLDLLCNAPAAPAPLSLQSLLERATVEHNQLFEPQALATQRSLLVTSGVDLVAYDRASGNRRWRLPLRPFALPLTWPSCGDGLVAATVIPSGDGAANGNAWKFMRSTPLELVVLDELSGQPLWTWPARPAGNDLLMSADAPAAPAPAAFGAAEDEALEAVRLREFSRLVPVGSPLVYGGRVFVGAAKSAAFTVLCDTYLLCFDARSGTLLWQRFVGSGPVAHLAPADHTLNRMAPVTDGECVYVQGGTGTLVAVDLTTSAVVWARGYEHPRVDGSNASFIASSQWPSTLPDAPTVCAGRLLVTDVYGPTLRCVDTAAGDTLWEIRKMTPRWRVGLQNGVIFWAGASTLVGYAIESGEERFKATLPGEVTGRGFVSSDAAYLPTAVGVVRVPLDEGAPRVVVPLTGDRAPTRCVIPVGNLALCVGDQHVRLYGLADQLLAEVRAAPAEGGRASLREFWLGDLFLQQGNLDEADPHLRAALAALQEQGTSPDDDHLRGLVDADLVALGRRRAVAQRGSGHPAEALAELRRAADAVVSPTGKLLAEAALAEHFELTGQTADAEVACRRVIGDPLAATTLVSTNTLGLSRTLVSEAESILARLRARPGDANLVGLSQATLARLTVQPIASLAWNAPSYVLPIRDDPLAAVVWVRPDGLAVQGDDGRMRWLFRGMPEVDDRLLWAAAGQSMVVLKNETGLVAHRLSDGEAAWRWRSQERGVLADPPAGRLTVAARALRRTFGPAAAATLGGAIAEAPSEYARGLVAAGRGFVVSTPVDKEAPAILTRLDAATGEESWSFDLTAGLAPRDVLFDGRNLVAVMQAADGRFQVLAFDELTGNPLWQYNATVPPGRQVSWWVEGGLIVVNDSAGQCTALRTGDGSVAWRNSIDNTWLPGARPIFAGGDRVVFDCAQGYAAVSLGAKRVVWRRPVVTDPLLPRSHVDAGEQLIVSAAEGLTAVDLSSGNVLWQRPLADFGETEVALLACNDLLVVAGQRSVEATLHFVDPASGRLLGDLPLAVNGGPVVMNTIRGGLLVQCGDEVLSVCAGSGQGVAPSRPTGPILPKAAPPAAAVTEPASTLRYSGDDLAAGPGKMTVRCVRGERGLWEMDLVRPKDSREVRIYRFDDLTDSGAFDYGPQERNPQGFFSVHLAKFLDDDGGYIELHKGEDALEFAVREATDRFVVITRYRLAASDAEGLKLTAWRTLINTTNAVLRPIPNDQMQLTMVLGVGSFDGRAKGARCRLDEKVDAQGRRFHRTPSGDPALWILRGNYMPGGDPKFDRAGMLGFEATIADSPAARSLGLVPGRQFRLETDVVGYYPASNTGRAWLDQRMDTLDGLYLNMSPREWYGSRRENQQTGGLAADEATSKTFTLTVNIAAK